MSTGNVALGLGHEAHNVTPAAWERGNGSRHRSVFDVAELVQELRGVLTRAEALTSGATSLSSFDAPACLARLLEGRYTSSDVAGLGIPLASGRLLHAVFTSPPAADRALRGLPVMQAVLLRNGDTCTALLRNVPRSQGADRALGAAKQLAAWLRKRDRGMTVGISAPIMEAGDLRVAARDAEELARLASDRPEGVALAEASWHELLLQRIQRCAAEVGHNPLLSLLAYDSQQGTDLTRSLTLWLCGGGDTATAAQALHVHVNTLRYRIRRASQICGVDLTDARQRLALTLLVASQDST
jgi:hypothetical protein